VFSAPKVGGIGEEANLQKAHARRNSLVQWTGELPVQVEQLEVGVVDEKFSPKEGQFPGVLYIYILYIP
jgi:hypothetical protein